MNDIQKAISEARCGDPFAWLGMHKPGEHIVVRAYHPEARAIRLVELDRDGRRHPMKRDRARGFFEIRLEEREMFFPYQLEVEETSGHSYVSHDPYAFAPILSDYDLHLFSEGTHMRAYEMLGAHPRRVNGVDGVFFATWAPNAQRISVVGTFNNWDGRRHPMRCRGPSGVWELFMPGLQEGDLYKYEIRRPDTQIVLKADPYGTRSAVRPKTDSMVWGVKAYSWGDEAYMAARRERDFLHAPMSVYEVHLGSWQREGSEEGAAFLNYREMGERLAEYVKRLGYTHVELLPIAEHPLDESWGYQVTGFFAPTSRYGTPEDFKYFVDHLHQQGIGVIMDWVPGHFPGDEHGLAWFDGSALYEHADPRQGEHKGWGTKVFNYGRCEVRSFLISNALYWLDQFHIDGLRVDAVASMLYLDYDREESEWVPNRYGGNENLEAIDFLKRLNVILHERYPGSLMIAEESTAWPGVSRPVYLGGLGFSMKWNMGWMHDILTFFSKDPLYRKYHHDLLTFAMLYAFHENFVLALSHDEVVHGKRTLIDKMPGDLWQKFANLRLLFGYMYAQPGKKLIFMGGEFGQWTEWYAARALDWNLLEYDQHRLLTDYVRRLNELHVSEPALHELDFDESGFEWIDFHDTEGGVISFVRRARDPRDYMVCVFNTTPTPKYGYRIGVPETRFYQEILNSDSEMYWGSILGNAGGVQAEASSSHGQPASIEPDLPPLGVLYFKPA